MHNSQPTLMRPEPVRAPPHGPVARLSESGSSSDPPVPIPMAFVNEIVSDADIDRYDLPFEKGAGRYWTRDKERDIYLWGGLVGNPAYGEPVEGRFHFGISHNTILLSLSPGCWSAKFSEIPYVVTWESVNYLQPRDPDFISRDKLLSLLREALVCFGRNGRKNNYTEDILVKINF